MTKEKTCGNCRDKEGCSIQDLTYPTKITDCGHWVPDYETLKSQLARYQRHEFDPEKRETCPPIEEDVLVWNKFNSYINAKISEDGEWFDYNDYNLNTRAFKVIGWSHLPGEEG